MSFTGDTPPNEPATPNSANKKALRVSAEGWIKGGDALLLRGALELRGELRHAAGGVDQALLTGVGRMGVHGHVAEDDLVLDAIDGLLAGRLEGRAGEEALARGDIEEADVVESGMTFGFHGGNVLGCRVRFIVFSSRYGVR